MSVLSWRALYHVISLGRTEHLVSGRIAAAKMLAFLTR
jgi:hypothetical protein